MKDEELEIAFQNAVRSVNEHTEPFPADFLLRVYAFYKRATNDQDSPSGNNSLINAFKTNALFQTHNLNSNEAKQLYIETVSHYFLYRK